MAKSLKIAIDATLEPNSGAGGVESILISQIKALGKLRDGNEEYRVIVSEEHQDWIRPYLSANQSIVTVPSHNKSSKLKQLLKPVIPKLNKIRGVDGYPKVPISNGFYESLGVDVLHFTYGRFTISSVPSVYTLYDAQHLHYAQFFTPQAIRWREIHYPMALRIAQKIITASQFSVQDLQEKYGISPKKIQMIPTSIPTQAYIESPVDNPQDTLKKYHISTPFILYPAMTWEHKNHIRLLQAIAYLRDEHDVHINLVCTGSKKPFYTQIESEITRLSLTNQVKFIGFVSHSDLQALYKLSMFVIIPSVFEGVGLPPMEAWHHQKAVACSNITSLPEIVQNSALTFDPLDIHAIASCIKELTLNDDLRQKFEQRGIERAKDFSWERTAKATRAIYRQVAKQQLSEEETHLLNWDWMNDPNH